MLKQIDNTIPLPKYYQIGESIKEKIAAGEYVPGEKIPTCRELSAYFGATLVTVSNAMRQLEQDGYISRIQGKGMFVTVPKTAANTAGVRQAIGKVGMAMPARGDLYQNLAQVLVDDLEKREIYTIPQPPTLSDYTLNIAEKEKYLKKYVANGLQSLVMEGTRHMPFKLLHKYRDDFRQLNFLVHFDSCIDFPEANIITYDLVQAGRLAAEHLVKAGREKFVFVTYAELPEAERKRNGSRDDLECHDMITLTGMKAALDEAGFPESSLTVIRGNAPVDEDGNLIDYTELLKRGPLGIFALGDFRAVPIIKAATKMGLDFKRNLSMVGLYNTTWAQVLEPTLTSISINETEIAHRAADCIIKRKTGQRIEIEPRLVVRET